MINALTAILNYYEADVGLTALIGTRIATKHKFGTGNSDAWPKPSKAVTLAWSGGDPDIYTKQRRPRLEARCYGERGSEAVKVALALLEPLREFTRTVVATPAGNALICWIVADSEPDMQYDAELEIDFAQVFLRAAVAEEAVP